MSDCKIQKNVAFITRQISRILGGSDDIKKQQQAFKPLVAEIHEASNDARQAIIDAAQDRAEMLQILRSIDSRLK